MDDWRETCDEIEAAAAKATARPWGPTGWFHHDNEIIGSLPSKRGMWKDRPDDEQTWEYDRVCEPERPDDGAYITLAANNADRLARFTTELSKEAQLLWAKLHGVKIGIGGIQAFNEMVDRIWEESAK